MTPYSLAGKRVWVAGHRGLVGSALVRRLAREDCEILTVPRAAVDLRDAGEVNEWMARHRPQAVFLAAASVGGIGLNVAQPARLAFDNMLIAANVIGASHHYGVEKLLFLGSSCVYPADCPQPIDEDMLLSGPLEPTNRAYAVAKIAGLELVRAYRAQYGCDFIAAMPCNLYGPGDRFDADNGHMVPALIMRAHRAARAGASELVVWGTGVPRRELMHVDDAADGLVFLMQRYSGPLPINIGTGTDVPIAYLALQICEAAGFHGPARFDPSKPDGVKAKCLDVSRMAALGWRAKIGLAEGLKQTCDWYRAQQNLRGSGPVGEPPPAHQGPEGRGDKE